MFKKLLIENVVPPLVVAVGSALTGVLTLLLVRFKQWLDAKVKDTKANTILKRMADAAADVVRDVSAVEAKTMLDLLADDGHLSPDDRAKLRAAGIDRLKTYMGPKALGELKDAMKIGAEAVEVIVAGKLEKAVDDMKLARAAAVAATPVALIGTSPK